MEVLATEVGSWPASKGPFRCREEDTDFCVDANWAFLRQRAGPGATVFEVR